MMSNEQTHTYIAPWKDYEGNLIRVGDEIVHPSGQSGIVVLVEADNDADKWRVDYGIGGLSRLSLQIGDKGQAVVHSSSTGGE